MNLHIFKTEQELIFAFAKYFIYQANLYIKSQGHFNVVLAGGNSPKRVYEVLATPDFNKKVDWEKVYFFFGDERYVPADDPQNNALMVKKALFSPLKIAASNVFKIDTSLPPADAAQHYNTTISEHFKGATVRFDLILLGLGDNAHTASLFPFTEVLKEKTPTVKAVFLKTENTYRITLTAPLINQAKQIAYLVFGENKASAVHQVMKENINYEKFPAQLIQPTDGQLHWFLDKMAAKLV